MQPLMPKATAVWLVDNTTLTFEQIAEFVGMHPLEISGIADGEVAVGIKGFDPVSNSQLDADEIEKAQNDPKYRMKLKAAIQTPPVKKKAPRYTPLSKRQERPSAIAWLVRNHPELADSQISKLLGTTKQTIESIRNKSHWNSANIQPVDPVALGLCRQIDLDAAVKKAADKKAKMDAELGVAAPAERDTLMSTEDSLAPPLGDSPTIVPAEEEAAARSLEDLGAFIESRDPSTEDREEPAIDPDSIFNLPKGGGEDDDEAADKV